MEKSLPTNNKRKAIMNQGAIRYDNHLISTQPNMDANTTTATPENENNPLPTRFEVELEFVQSLANIPYVTYLFTQQQTKENNNFNWKSPEFKNYLKYLEYWCQPPYSQCIVYPNALHVLKLINGFFEANATVNEDGLLDGVDELPRFLQLQGPHIMNEMVNRWEQ